MNHASLLTVSQIVTKVVILLLCLPTNTTNKGFLKSFPVCAVDVKVKQSYPFNAAARCYCGAPGVKWCLKFCH